MKFITKAQKMLINISKILKTIFYETDRKYYYYYCNVMSRIIVPSIIIIYYFVPLKMIPILFYLCFVYCKY